MHQNAPKSVSWSFAADPTGELTALLKHLSGFKRTRGFWDRPKERKRGKNRRKKKGVRGR